jgi:hypothetical protein
MSVRGERCAYLEGSAYLLDFRFFLGWGEDVGDVVVVDMGVVRVRLELRVEVATLEAAEGILATGGVDVYWYFVNWPLKDGVDGVSMGLGVSSGVAPEVRGPSVTSDFATRFDGIVRDVLGD